MTVTEAAKAVLEAQERIAEAKAAADKATTDLAKAKQNAQRSFRHLTAALLRAEAE